MPISQELSDALDEAGISTVELDPKVIDAVEVAIRRTRDTAVVETPRTLAANIPRL